MHKFLLIFHTLVQTINSNNHKKKLTDLFWHNSANSKRNLGLLKNNIDSLNLSGVLKSALQKLKGLIIRQTKDSQEGKPGDPEPENAQHTSDTEEASKASREGREEQWSKKNKK